MNGARSRSKEAGTSVGVVAASDSRRKGRVRAGRREDSSRRSVGAKTSCGHLTCDEAQVGKVVVVRDGSGGVEERVGGERVYTKLRSSGERSNGKMRRSVPS